MKRKWQRVLSWILTLTMLLSTFQGTGFSVFAGDDEDVTISDDAVLDGDPEDIDEPEEPDNEVTVTIVDVQNSDWGLWTPAVYDDVNDQYTVPGELVVYPGKTLVSNFNFNTDAVGGWHVAFGTEGADIDADHPYTISGFKFEVNEDVVTLSTVSPAVAMDTVNVVISSNDGIDYPFTLTVADKDQTLYIMASDDKDNAASGWDKLADGSNDVVFDNEETQADETANQGVLTAILGKGDIANVQFQVIQGPEREKYLRPTDYSNYTNIDWELHASTDDGEIGELIAKIAHGTSATYHGLTFEHYDEEEFAGILDIHGTPDETLDNTLLYLKAVNLADDDKRDEVASAQFAIFLDIDDLQPSVRMKEESEDAFGPAYGEYWDHDNDNETPDVPCVDIARDTEFVATVGYTVESSTAQNAVSPITYVLRNANTIMDITGAELSLVKPAGAATDDTACFDVSYSFDKILKGDVKTVKFTVAPVADLTARPTAYVADLVLTGKELPTAGIVLAHLSFTVNPAFIMKVNGEKKELTQIVGGYNYQKNATTDPKNVPAYSFEIGTYDAGKVITDGITLNVSSAEEGKSVWFLIDEEGGTLQKDLPAGLELGNAGHADMLITGYLDPLDWSWKNNDQYPKFEKDVLTGDINYYIPFPVIDNTENVIVYIGKLVVKPADITLEMGKNGASKLSKEDMSTELNGDVWVGQHDRTWWTAVVEKSMVPDG